jgi:TPR repeat protein
MASSDTENLGGKGGEGASNAEAAAAGTGLPAKGKGNEHPGDTGEDAEGGTEPEDQNVEVSVEAWLCSAGVGMSPQLAAETAVGLDAAGYYSVHDILALDRKSLGDDDFKCIKHRARTLLNAALGAGEARKQESAKIAATATGIVAEMLAACDTIGLSKFTETRHPEAADWRAFVQFCHLHPREVRCLYGLGWCYETGKDGPKDITRAIDYYQLAAGQGHANAQRHLGVRYYFSEGEGVPKDAKRAAEFLRLATDQGDVSAHVFLGLLYQRGDGVPKDAKRALELFQLAVDQGNASGQAALGRCYRDGEGVRKNAKRAAELFQLAATQGDPQGQVWLGVCYADGEGVPKDAKRAAGLFQLAADQGDAKGQFNLALCYERGDGVLKDVDRAIELYQQAVDQGFAEAREELQRLVDPNLVQRLARFSGVEERTLFLILVALILSRIVLWGFLPTGVDEL